MDSIQGGVDARAASRHAALLSHFGGCRSCHTLDSCHPWKQYSRRCESHSWRPRTTTTDSPFTSLNGQERSITNGHSRKSWPNKSEQPGDTNTGGASDRTSEQRFPKSVTFQHHFQHKACASNCFVLSKSPTPLHSCGEQTRHVCHSRRKLSTAPSGRRNGSSDLVLFTRLETDHGSQQSWSRSRPTNCRRPRRRRVPRIPLLRRPFWCRQQWQRLEYQHQGACHSEFPVDSIAGDTASNSTRSSRTFVMMALRKEQRALRRGHIR